MIRDWFTVAVCVFLLAIFTGCQSYRRKPLDTGEIFRQVDLERRQSYSGSVHDAQPAVPAAPLGFGQAADCLSRNGPSLREARAEYETALAAAKLKTPLPNPGLEVGPNFGFGPDIGDVNRVQPFGSLGFSIPLGKRLRRQDELNRAVAERARVEWILRHREAFLELRALYANWALSLSRLKEMKLVAESAERSVQVGRSGVAAGFATALDVGMLEIEAARTQLSALEAEDHRAEVEAALAELLGIHTDRLATAPDDALPKLPDQIPNEDELKQWMLAHHPELARLRADYEASERGLRLEISRQYPDFHFGPSYDGETGEKKIVLGLTLGLELPLFDRNQQGIATATLKREELRIKYTAAAHRALARLDRARKGCQWATERQRLLASTLRPHAKAQLDLAARSLEAGASDALHFLDAERSYRSVVAESLEAEVSVYQTWIALEQAVGLPILSFESGVESELPETPQAAESAPEESLEKALEQSRSQEKGED